MDNFLENLIPLFGIIFTFGIPGILIFWGIHVKHQEKMKLIEKGFSAEEARAFFGGSVKKASNPYGTLKWGIVLTFVGLGFVISFILSEVYDMSESITPALLLLFAGIGFILYYLIMNSKIKKEESNPPKVQ